MTNFDFTIFFFGCLGAAAPEVIRVYKTKKFDFAITWKLAFVSLVFFLLGGAVAVMLEPPTPYAAFYTGAAAPILVSKIGEKSPIQEKETIDQWQRKSLSVTTDLKVKHQLSIREYRWML